MEWFEIEIAVTASIPFRIQAEDAREAASKSLELAKEQFPGALDIQLVLVQKER